MESKHTPGPWSVGFHDGTGPTYITAGDHPALKKAAESIVVVVSGSTDDWGVEHGVRNSADALLIAAAPELLDALVQLSNSYAFMKPPGSPKSDSEKKAEAAIAKATGATHE
jgi:hypothetical protein